jgi:hypothetical protein
MGMTEAEIEVLDFVVRSEKLEKAPKRMYQTGAHYVVNFIGNVPPLLERMTRGWPQPSGPSPTGLAPAVSPDQLLPDPAGDALHNQDQDKHEDHDRRRAVIVEAAYRFQ